MEAKQDRQTNEHRTQLLDTGIAYLRSGLSIIPIGQNKKPPMSWKQYQQRPMNEAMLRRYLMSPAVTGIAALGGAVSRNLLIVDFDIPEFYHEWKGSIGSLANG